MERPLPDEIARDPALRSLMRRVALADAGRFHLLLLVVPDIATAEGAVGVLRDEMPSLRDDGAGLAVLDPYEVFDDPARPTEPRALAEWLLDVLVPEEGERGPTVTVLNVSRAPSADAPAWVHAFARMNERRNVITAALSGPLLVVLPERMEPVFARHAPDVWSVRAPAARVGVGDEAEQRVRSAPPDGWLEAFPLSFGWSSTDRDRLDDDVLRAREGGDPLRLGRALVYRSELALSEGDRARAMSFAEEAARALERSGDRGLRATAEGIMGDLALAESDVDAALKAYERGLATLSKGAASDAREATVRGALMLRRVDAWARDARVDAEALATRAEGAVEYAREVSGAQGGLGGVERGHEPQARSGAPPSTSREGRALLAGALVRWGDALGGCGRHTEAAERYTEARAVLESLAAEEPTQERWAERAEALRGRGGEEVR